MSTEVQRQRLLQPGQWVRYIDQPQSAGQITAVWDQGDGRHCDVIWRAADSRIVGGRYHQNYLVPMYSDFGKLEGVPLIVACSFGALVGLGIAVALAPCGAVIGLPLLAFSVVGIVKAAQKMKAEG